MQQLVAVVVLACAATGCGGKKSDTADGGPQTYQLWVDGKKTTPDGGVTVKVTWPAGWKSRAGSPGATRPATTGEFDVQLYLSDCNDGKVGQDCIDDKIRATRAEREDWTSDASRGWAKVREGDKFHGNVF